MGLRSGDGRERTRFAAILPAAAPSGYGLTRMRACPRTTGPHHGSAPPARAAFSMSPMEIPLSRRHLLALAGLPWLAACAGTPPAGGAAPGGHARFDAWSEAFAADWVRLSPERATATQYFSGARQAALDRQLTPRSTAQRERVLALAQRGLRELARFDAMPLDAAQRQGAATLRWALQRQVDGAPFEDHVFVFSQTRGPHIGLPGFMAERHPLREPGHLDSYLARLEQVGPRMDEALARAQDAAARGLKPPRFIAERSRAQLLAFLQLPVEDTPFVTALRTRGAALGASEAHAHAHVRAVTRAQELVLLRVRPAWGRVAAWLTGLQPQLNDDAGLWRLPDGEAAYAQALAANTGTTMGADEIHAIGLREVARIEAEMDALLRRLGRGTGTVAERMRALNAELQPPAEPDPRPMLLARHAAYIEDAKRRAAPLFRLLPQAPVEVRRVPVLNERSSSAYYTTPAPDGSLPGIFWAPLPGPTFNILGMRTLAIHEAVPGHHFQLALMQEMTTLPRWRQRRIFGGGSAHSEGWALYAEQLAIEHGWYDDDPHGLLGALDAQLFRARRLVVDTGLHARRWTRQQAIDHGISASEVERYVVNPGQACAYMVGMLHLLRLREEARQTLGPRFTLPDFHDVLLGTGSVPLDVVTDAVRQWAGLRSG